MINQQYLDNNKKKVCKCDFCVDWAHVYRLKKLGFKDMIKINKWNILNKNVTRLNKMFPRQSVCLIINCFD